MRGGLLALVALLPVAPGLLLGQSFYFRDLSRHFFPLRRFALEGLARGEVRWWNPYVHEGEAMSLPPVAYPADLLQILWIDERWFSLLLALHLPLAALGMAALARELGAARPAAAGAGLVYAMGGFALSSLNFYVYLQALAWAPVVILLLGRAARDKTRRGIAPAAAAVAVACSTTGIEVVAQTLAIALVLALRTRERAPVLRAGLSLLLGLGLAAPVLFFLGDLASGSARGAGFASEVTLAHSVHPLTFVQTVVGSLYGDLTDLAVRWWGQNFFPGGFPYFVSLYLGAIAVGLAAAAAVAPGPHRRRLAVLGLLAAVVCLGRWAGGESVVPVLPFVSRFRIPAKAFFTVHLTVALLAAFALDDLLAGRFRRRYAVVLLVAGALLLAPAAAFLLPSVKRWWVIGFFPPGMTLAERLANTALILRDSATGALAALAGGALCLAAHRGRISPRALLGALCALISADLLRAGVGLNPTVGAAFYRLSPEMREVAARLRADDRRAFTCDVEGSPAYLAARAGRRSHVAWTFAALRETFTPAFNLAPGVRTGLTRDLTMLVPEARVLSPDEAECRDLERIVPQLRAAGVTDVFSIDPLAHRDLVPAGAYQPEMVAPLTIHRYALAGALPRIAVPDLPGTALVVTERPGRIEVRTELPRAAVLIVRDSRDRGWSALRNGRPVPWEPGDRHLAVRLEAGANHVVLAHRPPSLGSGLWCAAAALAGMAVVTAAGRRRGAG